MIHQLKKNGIVNNAYVFKLKNLDNSLNINIVEKFSENTVIIHQVHKRIWPSAQRESLFWSKKLDVTENREPNAIDAYMVCNHDTKIKNVSVNYCFCLKYF